MLIKELQSLGLDIKVLAENKEEIKISEVYEDDEVDTKPLNVRIDGREDDTSERDTDFGMFDEDEDEDDEEFDDDFDDDFDDFGDDDLGDDEDDEDEDELDDDFDMEPSDEDLSREEEEFGED